MNNMYGKILKETDAWYEDFKENIKSIFGNVKDETHQGGLEIENSNICVKRPVDEHGISLETGIEFYTINDVFIPKVANGYLDIPAPLFPIDKNGVEYGSSLSFYDDLSNDKIKSIYNDLYSKRAKLIPSDKRVPRQHVELLNEAQYQDTNYNTIVNSVVSALFPFCDSLEFKSMNFDYKLKNISGENKELIEEQYTKAMEDLKDTLAKEGLTLSTSAMGTLTIERR